MAPGRSIVAGQPARIRASSIATLSCAGLPPGNGPDPAARVLAQGDRIDAHRQHPAAVRDPGVDAVLVDVRRGDRDHARSGPRRTSGKLLALLGGRATGERVDQHLGRPSVDHAAGREEGVPLVVEMLDRFDPRVLVRAAVSNGNLMPRLQQPTHGRRPHESDSPDDDDLHKPLPPLERNRMVAQVVLQAGGRPGRSTPGTLHNRKRPGGEPGRFWGYYREERTGERLIDLGAWLCAAEFGPVISG
jgi:hypothetical protein